MEVWWQKSGSGNNFWVQIEFELQFLGFIWVITNYCRFLGFSTMNILKVGFVVDSGICLWVQVGFFFIEFRLFIPGFWVFRYPT